MAIKLDAPLPEIGGVRVQPDVDELRSFMWWMCERQWIWTRRFRRDEDRPWTDDQILREWHFCHVHRELDRGTRWLCENVLSRQQAPESDILLNVVVYRLLNRPETMQRIGGFLQADEFNPEGAADILNRTDDPVFSSAYRVTSEDFGYFGKANNVLLGIVRDEFLPELDEWTDRLHNPPSLETAWSRLQDLTGFGPFLSYEVVTDLNYEWWPQFSENDFVHVGRGAEWGLDLIFDRDDKELVHWLQEHHRRLFEDFDLDYPWWSEKPYLTLRDIEHSLCEWRKFRTIEDTGEGHRRFEPHDYEQDTLGDF